MLCSANWLLLCGHVVPTAELIGKAVWPVKCSARCLKNYPARCIITSLGTISSRGPGMFYRNPLAQKTCLYRLRWP